MNVVLASPEGFLRNGLQGVVMSGEGVVEDLDVACLCWSQAG